jgi:hypothetical protein
MSTSRPIGPPDPLPIIDWASYVYGNVTSQSILVDEIRRLREEVADLRRIIEKMS